jgi:hypothetical protein
VSAFAEGVGRERGFFNSRYALTSLSCVVYLIACWYTCSGRKGCIQGWVVNREAILREAGEGIKVPSLLVITHDEALHEEAGGEEGE